MDVKSVEKQSGKIAENGDKRILIVDVPEVEDSFLQDLAQRNAAVSVYLMNGIQLKGRLVSYDHSVVMLKNEQSQVVIYKHAISTIMPAV